MEKAPVFSSLNIEKHRVAMEYGARLLGKYRLLYVYIVRF